MNRLLSILGAATLGLAAIAPAQAATVIATGTIDPFFDNTFSIYTSVGPLAPGTYRFTLDITSDDLDYFIGDVIKTISDNEYTYLDGQGVVLTGGDDVDQYYSLTGSGPSDLSAIVKVNPDHSVPLDQGGHDDYYETCCRFEIEGRATSGGTYTLSYAAVPEPETWALTILGFGVVGAGLRSARRRAPMPGALLGSSRAHRSAA